MQTKRIVVTGIGTLNPLGNSLSEYWENLVNGVSGADMATQFDASKFKTKFACEIKGFDATNFMDRKEARKLDRFSQIALVASDQAVLDAGITKENVDHDRVGVIFASGIGGLTTFTEEVTNFVHGDGTPRFNPFFRYRCRANIDEAWFQRTQLCGCECLCFQYKCHYFGNG